MNPTVLWRRLLAACFADLIVGATIFNVSVAFILFWFTTVLAAISLGGAAFFVVLAFWVAFVGPYTWLIVILVRAAWKFPKELWRKEP